MGDLTVEIPVKCCQRMFRETSDHDIDIKENPKEVPQLECSQAVPSFTQANEGFLWQNHL